MKLILTIVTIKKKKKSFAPYIKSCQKKLYFFEGYGFQKHLFKTFLQIAFVWKHKLDISNFTI